MTHPELLETQHVTYAGQGATISAYLARPRSGGPYPALIVIHEAFGPNEHIHDVTRRFAAQGFVALAPNLYSRGPAFDPADRAAAMAAMFALPDAQAVADLEGAARFLREQPGTTGKVGCIGFCSGGRQTLLLACSSTVLDAAVDCWGGFITRATPTDVVTETRPVPVIDLVDRLACPLYAVFGAEDANPSPADAKLLEERLAAAHKTYTVEIFPDAGHAFFADYRDTYREAAAFALWPKVLDFFRRHLGGASA
ncbi:MAG: dienelactone hydrolase family protein [Actinomycetia bacterium]|nr:dienelactone hydrolase family protein [Actinomycetes bacterium]